MKLNILYESTIKIAVNGADCGLLHVNSRDGPHSILVLAKRLDTVKTAIGNDIVCKVDLNAAEKIFSIETDLKSNLQRKRK